MVTEGGKGMFVQIMYEECKWLCSVGKCDGKVSEDEGVSVSVWVDMYFILFNYLVVTLRGLFICR